VYNNDIVQQECRFLHNCSSSRKSLADIPDSVQHISKIRLAEGSAFTSCHVDYAIVERQDLFNGGVPDFLGQRWNVAYQAACEHNLQLRMLAVHASTKHTVSWLNVEWPSALVRVVRILVKDRVVGRVFRQLMERVPFGPVSK